MNLGQPPRLERVTNSAVNDVRCVGLPNLKPPASFKPEAPEIVTFAKIRHVAEKKNG